PCDLGPADPEAALPPRAEVPWLQPYPGPDDVTVARETIELAFVAAIQHLPPRQRAVLILRDVLGWPAGRCADLLEGSVAGVNSALQRARATLREHLPRGRLDWSAPPGMTPEEREVLRRYMDAMERFDLAALAELLAADVRGLMPPWPMWHRGREAMLAALATGGDQGFTMEPVLVNGGPGVAVRAGGRPFAISALRISGGRIAEIAAFHGLRNFDEFLARTPSQET
ncbi:MAG: SnoaL-like domain-containing protein, partial [Nonomuraea sp.]|nr:SnoaL-like domain-containing protein [Nonomuraea sp.]